MRTMQHVALTALVVAGLSLAGCGGSSSTARNGTPPAQEAGDSQISRQVSAILIALKAAEDKAKQSRDEALEVRVGSFEAISAFGDSSMAIDQAQAILDAEEAVAAALKTAEDNQTKARMAQTQANQLPADTPGLAELKKQVADAVTEAERVVRAIKAIQTATGTGTLQHAVGQVKGDDGMGTPAQVGMPIAKQIDAALMRRAAAGENQQIGNAMRMVHKQDGNYIAEVLPAATSTNLATTEGVRQADDAPEGARTAREVLGLKTDRQHPRYRINVDGVPAGTRDGVEACATCGYLNINRQNVAETEYLINSAGGLATTYKGFSGLLFCEGAVNGSSCRIEGADGRAQADDGVGTLRGIITWGTARPDDKYVWSPTKQIYELKAYAKYGYWLSSERTTTRSRDTSHDVHVHTFAYVIRPNTVAYSNGPDIDGAASATLARTGTYEGNALGISVVKSFNTGTGAVEDMKSGEFTADVTLKAVFGSSASLEGTIDNFQGDAVDPKWSVVLQRVADADLDFAIDGASPASVTQGSGDSGRWSALAYGAENKRPEGIVGAFNAYFKNGAAAGAYATKLKTQ